MGRLLQISGYPGGTTVKILVNFIQPLFKEENLQSIWLDPYYEPRAVALFACELEEAKLIFLRKHGKLTWDDCELTLEIVQPTSSIFIRTYGEAEFGAIDKLALLFNSRQRTVKKKEKIDADCYEISFHQNWDAVIEVCQKEWYLGKQKLTVCPYFDCFRQSLVDEHQQVFDEEEFEECGSKHLAHSKSSLPVVHNKKEPKHAFKNEFQFAKEEVDNTSVSTHIKILEQNDKRTIFVYFQHSLTPVLLKLLNFDKATDVYNCHRNCKNDDEELCFEIEGPKKIVKSISKMLNNVENLVYDSEPCNYFFKLDKVQKEITDHLKSSQSHAVLTYKDNVMHLQVSVSSSEKISFQEFVYSLVVIKEFHSLLKHVPEENEASIALINEFNDSYSYRQIYIKKFDVIYISLAFKKHDFDLLVDLINNQLKDIEKETNCCQEGKEKKMDGSQTNDHQDENISQANKIQQNPLTEITETKETKFEIYIVEDEILVMLFAALKLKQALESTYQCLEVQESNLKFEIIPKSAEGFDILKSIKKQIEKISYKDYEESFLKLKDVHRLIMININCSGSHVVLDNLQKGKLLHVVQTKINKRELLQDYVESLLVSKNCDALPSKSCQKSNEWQQFVNTFNAEHSTHQVYVRDDLSVILLSLNSVEGNVDLVAEINSTIAVLTQGEKNTLEDEEILMEKTNVDDLLNVSNDSVIKMTLVCENSFFVWLLDRLDFKDIVEKGYSNVNVNLAPQNSEIDISGSKVKVGNLKSTLIELDKMLPFTNDEDDFLNSDIVKKTVASIIRNCSWQIKIVDGGKIVLTDGNGDEKTFKDFTLNLFEHLECKPLPNSQLQFNSKWNSFIGEFHANNPLYHIMVKDVAVTLLSCSSASANNTSVVKQINDTIKSIASGKNIDRLENPTHPACVSDTEKLSLPMAKQQRDYFKKFQMAEFKSIKENYQPLNAQIELNYEGFEINCQTSMTKSIKEDLRKLMQIEHEDKHLSYPGLLPFIKSEEGRVLIENISETWRCLLNFPGIHTNKQHQNVETLEKHSVRPDYRAVLIKTAKCNGFKVHLIEGHIEDIESRMTVTFLPTQEGKPSVKLLDSSLHLCVLLPQWKVPTGEDITYLKTVRESFKEAICLVIQQALHHNRADLAFSTQNIHSTEYPFPLDCLADTITNVLTDLLSQVDDDSASSPVEEMNIYICEPKCEAVFKAFTYFAKNLSSSFGPPDQDVWDSLCAPNISQYPKYTEIPVAVEVTNYIPSEFERLSLFCYPILPSLDSASCPIVWEPTFSKKILEDAIKELLQKKPDGLLINQHFIVKLFHSPRDIIVYCSPEWGLDSFKTIYGALARCLSLSSEMEAVYIVPPGLPLPALSTYHKYPAKYLAITLFKVLDQLFAEKIIKHQKKIVFVVGNTKYEEVFKMELQRRYPQNSEKQQDPPSIFSIAYIKNLLLGGAKKKGTKPGTAFIKTTEPKIPISLYSHSKENINKAAETLNQELKILMSKNTEVLELDSNDTASFEQRIQNMQVLNIAFVLERNFEEETETQVIVTKKKKKRAKKKQRRNKPSGQNQATEITNPKTNYKVTGSLLTIQGLCRQFVVDFKREVVKCKKHSPNVNEGNDADDSNDSFYSDPGSDSGSDKLREEGSSIDPVDKADHHNAVSTSTIFPRADLCQKKPLFEWKYESEDGLKGTVFVPFEKEITECVEPAYCDENLVFHYDGQCPIMIDFCSMQATVEHSGRKNIKVIRSEILEAEDTSSTNLPLTWNTMKEEWCLLEIQESSAEFKPIKEQLLKTLDTAKHKVQIIKIERIQNPYLYKRTQTKLKLLKLTKSPYMTMWSRVLDETRLLVCQYGFHPALSASKNENLGNGVLFHADAQRCLEEKDMTDGKHICLISSQVHQGKTGPGRIGLRAPPLDEKTGQPCHSVTENGDCMIFSDAHVYPCHSVIFKMQKQMSPTAPEFVPKT